MASASHANRRLLITAFVILSSQFIVLSFHDRITTNVTWARDIAPIVQTRCVRCHHQDGAAPMALTTYDEARPWAKAIKEEVLARRMPKWHVVRGYGDFANDPSLSAFEIALIVAWADGGAPRGRVADAAVEPELRATDASLAPRVKYGDEATRELTMRCGARSLPAGRLLAVRPRLDRGGSAGIAVVLPGGRREIVAWIRDFDPDFAETYWLRTPLTLPRRSKLAVNASGRCEITVSLAR